MADLKVTGLVELARVLKKNVKMDDVKTVVQKNGADLQRTMQLNQQRNIHLIWNMAPVTWRSSLL